MNTIKAIIYSVVLVTILSCSMTEKLLDHNVPTESELPTFTPTPGKYYTFTQHWYRNINIEKRWKEASEYCNTIDGYLVTISSEEENEFVYAINPNSWLGLSDNEKEGEWKWVTGEPLLYENWVLGEPNNCTQCSQPEPEKGEDYGIFNGDGTSEWNDVPDMESTFVCEWGNY